MYTAHTAVESITTDHRLLLPMLALASHSQRWITLMNPASLPSQAELKHAGIDPSRLRVIQSQGKYEVERYLEQACRAGTSSLVLAWTGKRLKPDQMSRLQEACRQGETLCMLMNPQVHAMHADPSVTEEQIELAL
jgi:cell division inhibitor SulA